MIDSEQHLMGAFGAELAEAKLKEVGHWRLSKPSVQNHKVTIMKKKVSSSTLFIFFLILSFVLIFY